MLILDYVYTNDSIISICLGICLILLIFANFQRTPKLGCYMDTPKLGCYIDIRVGMLDTLVGMLDTLIGMLDTLDGMLDILVGIL